MNNEGPSLVQTNCTLQSSSPGLISSTVSHEARSLPELMPFDDGATLTLSWGDRNPDDFEGWRSTGWRVMNLSSGVVPFLVFGAVLLLVGAAAIRLALDQVPQETSAWGSHFLFGFAALMGLSGLRVMLEPWARYQTSLPALAEPGPWQRDWAWQATSHLENGSGQRDGLAHLVKSFVLLPVMLAFLVLIHLPPLLAPDDLAPMRVVGLDFQLHGWAVWWAVVAVIDFVFLAAIGAMIYTIVQRLRFGRRSFQVFSLPARPGGQLRAQLRFGRGVQATGDTRCELHCIDFSRQTEAIDRSRYPSAPVSRYCELRVLNTRGQHVRQLDLDFDLPPDLPGTRIRPEVKILWRLIIRIPARGPDYRGEFIVPVYADTDPPQ